MDRAVQTLKFGEAKREAIGMEEASHSPFLDLSSLGPLKFCLVNAGSVKGSVLSAGPLDSLRSGRE